MLRSETGRCKGRGCRWRCAIACVTCAIACGCFVAPQPVQRPRRSRLDRHHRSAARQRDVQRWTLWTAVEKAAGNNESEPEAFITAIQGHAEHYMDSYYDSEKVLDRSGIIDAMVHSMEKAGMTSVVLGGKNRGKSLLARVAVRKCDSGDKVVILQVNMKSGGSLFESLAASAVNQVLKKEDFEKLREAMSQFVVQFKNMMDGPVGQVVSPFGNSLLGVLDRIGLKIGLGLFLGEVKGLSKKVAVVVDEADPCLRELSDGQSEMSKSQSELNTLIEWAQDKLISLVLISSDFTLPFRLQAAGFDRDIGKVMIIGEVLEPEMLKMLQDWGMDVDLAEKFYAYFGGDIFTTKQALDMLIDQKEAFDPFAVIQCPGLGSCVKDPKARTHLELMAKQGFSLVEDVKADEGARLIEQANVGVLIAKGAIKFNLPAIFADTGHQWAVVPPSYHMKVRIAHELENTRLPTSGQLLELFRKFARCSMSYLQRIGYVELYLLCRK